MIGALRIFAFAFFAIAALVFLGSFLGGFNVVGFGIGASVVFSGVLCAAAATALEKLTEMEQHQRMIAQETLAMHRTIALNAPLQNAAE